MTQPSTFAVASHRPQRWDGTTLVLFHGTGGDERDMIPLGQQIAPDALLIGMRGRSIAEPARRWFRRLTATTFDQDDIRQEAASFAEFFLSIVEEYGVDLQKTAFVGYSNGANFIGALMLLHPEVARNAVLLRPMLALTDPPSSDLGDHHLLLLAGKRDPYGGQHVVALERSFVQAGATVALQQISAGHELTADDFSAAKSWLNENLTKPR